MKCSGIIGIVENCPNKAKWKAIGFSAQFGVPSIDFVCDNCKRLMIKYYRPKIMEYNQFELTFEEFDEQKNLEFLEKKIRELESQIKKLNEKVQKIQERGVARYLIYKTENNREELMPSGAVVRDVIDLKKHIDGL